MIKLRDLLFGKPDCDCGCDSCEGTKLNEGVKVSENLQYHLDNKIPLGESVFRISSNAHVKLFAETRKLWEANKITLSEADEYFMSTDAGRQGMYEGQLVPLDLPYILNEYKDEPSYDGPNPPIIAVRVDDEKFLDNLEDEGIDHGYDDAQDPDEGPDKGFRYIIYGKKEEKKDIIDFLKHLMKPYGNDVRIDNESLEEIKKKKNPPLNKPKRGGPKAYYVYVRDPKTKKIKKVTFGSGGLKAKIGNKEASQAFAKRHDCKNKKDRTKASYWSCNLPRYHKQLGLGTPASTYW